MIEKWLRRRVNDICAPPRHESGPVVSEFRGSDRIAVMVHWSADGSVSRSVSQSVLRLAERGYRVVICSTCEAPGALRWKDGEPADTAVYRRPNVGIDFGTWGAMLTHFPELRTPPHVLLLNDSLVGPFAPLDDVINRFEGSGADIWGLVDSNQHSAHFQSHFVGYRGGVLTDPPLVRFWSNIRLQPSKEAMIDRYERGLYPLLQLVGYRLGVGFPWQDVVANGQNPTIMGWRRLLQFGFPYVKRELIWKPFPKLRDADAVPQVVRERFGAEVEEWL